MSKFNFMLHHASLVVSDAQKSLEFYCGVLGLDQTERPDLPFPGAWLQIGAQQIHLLQLSNPDPVEGRPDHGGRDRHVALCVDQIGPVRAALDAASVHYTLSKSGRQALFCRDRDGNTIEILEQM